MTLANRVRHPGTAAMWVWAVCALTALSTACSDRLHVGQEMYRVPNTALALPRVGDWVQDTTVTPADVRTGGLLMRLVQPSYVPGSPRIEVLLEPPRPQPTVLADYLTRNLQDMGALETAGQIRILHVDQQRIVVGRAPAYRVHHEFTTGTGAAQVSLYQVSTFLVFDGRGITISAAGRTELFHPLATSITGVLDGAQLDGTGRRGSLGTAPHAPGSAIDLGTLGGDKR